MFIVSKIRHISPRLFEMLGSVYTHLSAPAQRVPIPSEWDSAVTQIAWAGVLPIAYTVAVAMILGGFILAAHEARRESNPESAVLLGGVEEWPMRQPCHGLGHV